jgi:hypothetical protein
MLGDRRGGARRASAADDAETEEEGRRCFVGSGTSADEEREGTPCRVAVGGAQGGRAVECGAVGEA